jgi:uncharacterized LabA/DUF88 family protein
MISSTFFSMIQHQHQRVGVFIDVQNMYYSARHLFNRKVNFAAIVKKAVGDRQLIRAIAYVVSTKTDEHRPFFDALINSGIETKEKELIEFAGGQKKADWDVGIAVDAIRLGENLDVIVLVSGDGDFIPLVDYLQSKGKIVEVASFRETTAGRLVEQVGQANHINLSAVKRLVLIPDRYVRLSSRASTDTSVHSTTPTPHITTPAVVPSTVSPSAPTAPPKRPRGRPTKKVSAPKADDDFLSPNERFLNQ